MEISKYEVPEIAQDLFQHLNREMVEVIFENKECMRILISIISLRVSFKHLTEIDRQMRRTQQSNTQFFIEALMEHKAQLAKQIAYFQSEWEHVINNANKLTREDKKRIRLMRQAGKVIDEYCSLSPDFDQEI